MVHDTFDSRRFDIALDKYLSTKHERYNIGTYKEHSLHLILKYFISADPSTHEIKLGEHIADVFCRGEIYEIQTGSLNPLRDKLESFLKEYKVNVVVPICVKKRIIRQDPGTGEVLYSRISNKHESENDIFFKLCPLKGLLGCERLSFTFFMYEGNEYRYANKRVKVGGKYTEKIDCVPYKYSGTLRINGKDDYKALLGDIPQSDFTLKEYTALSHRRKEYASAILYVLKHAEVIKVCGRSGRENVYRVCDRQE